MNAMYALSLVHAAEGVTVIAELFCGGQAYDQADEGAQYRNAEVRYQNVPGIHVRAVYLEYTCANETGEQSGCRSGHAWRKDRASAQHKPDRNGCDDADWGTGPQTRPTLGPELSFLMKLEQN